MNNLLLGLSIAGGLVLAGVVAHGTWTARKAAPKLAQDDGALPSSRSLSSVDGAAGEPVALHAGDHDIALDDAEHGGSHNTTGQPIEPVFNTAQFDKQLDHDLSHDLNHNLSRDLSHDLALAQAADKKANLDALIDVVAVIQLEAQVSGDAVLAALPVTRRVGSKPFAVEGLVDETDTWESPKAGQRYKVLQAGVQLSNRTGALNEIEYSEFVVKTQTFADELGGVPEFPEMLDEVARARELDVFASSHDAQLNFTIHALGAAWSTGYVVQNAARLGFVAGALPGRMVLPGSNSAFVNSAFVNGYAPALFTLSFDTQAAMDEDAGTQSAIREVRLSLDVPHVAASERPFARMRECAAALAKTMDGVVCDDQGLAVNEKVLDGVETDLEHLYQTLDRRDLSAGSPLARRLFS